MARIADCTWQSQSPPLDAPRSTSAAPPAARLPARSAAGQCCRPPALGSTPGRQPASSNCHEVNFRDPSVAKHAGRPSSSVSLPIAKGIQPPGPVQFNWNNLQLQKQMVQKIWGNSFSTHPRCSIITNDVKRIRACRQRTNRVAVDGSATPVQVPLVPVGRKLVEGDVEHVVNLAAHSAGQAQGFGIPLAGMSKCWGTRT